MDRAQPGLLPLWFMLGAIGLASCGDDSSARTGAGGAPEIPGAGTAAAANAGAASPDGALPPDAAPGADAGRDPDAGAADAGAAASGRGGEGGGVSAPFSDWPVSCRNGLRDGDETDIDCGGPDCGTCLSGRRCERGSDCLSAECAAGACTCVPLGECPQDACGSLRQCGEELDCGACASGVCYENRCCTPRACGDAECGVFADGCGGTVRCGDEDCCTPRTCEHASLENRCGDFDDRCGASVSCSCENAQASCYLGECCTPHGCDGATHCGVPISDGCGGVQTCGCAADETCYLGECCARADCSAWAGPGCAALDDGCGGTLSCGCAAGERCHEGECCTASACAAGAAGDACGQVDDGCGGVQSCGCAGGLQCVDGRCCNAQTQTCSERGLDQRCGPAPALCGATNQWCGCGQSPGMRVAQRNACGDACADTLGAVRSCAAAAALEELVQISGWDFPQSLSSSLCNASYGFSPNWTDCHTGFQLDARGFVFLGVGTHCFSITGRGQNSCGALYFVDAPDSFVGWDAMPDTTAASAVTGDAPVCFELAAADYYPIRWHYTQDAGLEDFHVNYCAGSAATCAPLTSAILYPALP